MSTSGGLPAVFVGTWWDAMPAEGEDVLAGLAQSALRASGSTWGIRVWFICTETAPGLAHVP